MANEGAMSRRHIGRFESVRLLGFLLPSAIPLSLAHSGRWEAGKAKKIPVGPHSSLFQVLWSHVYGYDLSLFLFLPVSPARKV